MPLSPNLILKFDRGEWEVKVYIEATDEINPELETLITLPGGQRIQANLEEADFSLALKDERHAYLYGDIFYHITGDGGIKLIDSSSKEYLNKIFSASCLEDLIPALEGQYIGILVDDIKKTVQIFSDRYARLDTFYMVDNDGFYLATDLDFIFRNAKPDYDQKMLAHLFSVYGWYTPKGLTIYRNVKQLKVGEIITVSEEGITSETIEFKPLEIENYTDEDLELYYKILKESVVARANREGTTWISSSSGWDSTMLLALLVDEFGSHNVRMLTGSMKYSKTTEVINKFEISKINRIAKYYGIKPLIIDFDLENKNASDYWKRVLPYYKSRHMYSGVTYNYTRLSDELYRAAGNVATILNGETSDSFHNFGFSQFATFFHTKKSFAEYADKMNCYFYGPSFFKKVLDGSFEKDKVFVIFKKMREEVEFYSSSDLCSKDELIQSYLFPFFYGSPRVPFAKTYRNPLLTEKGQRALYDFLFREYMPEILSSLTESNIYSWLIYLYHSFHAQGSTVNVPKHAMDFNEHHWRQPFNDYRLIEFLSKAPEKWGRGLELNNTKYPLRWVARNKVNFPYGLLDEGPHSYLYDVIEGFSLAAEITYRSGVTDFFKETLWDKPYRGILDGGFFDLAYLDKLCSDFLEGKEVKGQDFNNLYSLITFCVTGWY